jgi:hypothetical protein
VIPPTKPRCSKIFQFRATIACARVTTDKACLAQNGAAAAFPSRRPHPFQYSPNLLPDAGKILDFWRRDPTCHSRNFFSKNFRNIHKKLAPLAQHAQSPKWVLGKGKIQ